MKKVLVTGCNGQLGRAIQKEYAGQVEFILTDVAEGENITSLDITDIDAVMTLALDKKPDVIINCAALTNVDGCEKMWDLAYKINAIGPRNLADRCNDSRGKTGTCFYRLCLCRNRACATYRV